MGPNVRKYPFVTVDEWSGACSSFAEACETSVGRHDGWSSISHHTLHDVDLIRIVRRVARASDGSADGEQRRADAISNNCGGAREKDEPDELDELEDEPELDDEHDDGSTACMPFREAAPVQVAQVDDDSLTITYDVVLSPSYCVPVLHFTVRTSTGGPVTDLAAIYADVVPVSFRRQVEDVGVVGGISMMDHPVTGLPSFFIHPCNTTGALMRVSANRPVPVSEYLFLWMGIIPGCVGLYAPFPSQIPHSVPEESPEGSRSSTTSGVRISNSAAHE